MAFAHTDGDPYGTTKTYCEEVTGDMATHDYGPCTGFVGLLGNDGSLVLSSDGSYDECRSRAGTREPYRDGHEGFALGGAYLVAGWGASDCFHHPPDHPSFPEAHVWGRVLSDQGADVHFLVHSDLGDECYDFEGDVSVECVNACRIHFPPGVDGLHHVYVDGFTGHFWTE